MRKSLGNFVFAWALVNMIYLTGLAATSGSLDPSFGVSGKVVTNVFADDFLTDLAVQQDGKIVAVGQNATNDFVVVRYNVNGSLDTTFSGDGIVFTDFSSGVDRPTGVSVQTDGRIVVSGRSGSDFAIARYNSNGSLDTSFDTDGKVIVPTGDAAEMDLQPDGKIVVVGTSSGNFVVVRLNLNGSLDNTFDTDGRVDTDLGSNDFPNAVKVQPDGKIVVAGQKGGLGGDVAVVRYNINGSLDTTFSGDGIAANDFGNFETFTALAIQDNGAIVLTGTLENALHVVRLTAAGVLDSSFDGDGRILVGIQESSGFGVAIQSDGKIIIGGGRLVATTLEDIVILRLNINGSLDTSFGSSGIVITEQNSFSRTNLALVGDKLVVGNNANGVADFGLERYNLSNTPTQSGDFDGDGIPDTAVFRPATGLWFIMRSSDSSVLITQFGLNGDVPLDGDFDGDGRGDLAIFRPSSGVWFFQRSSDGSVLGATFGVGTDKPVPGDFDKDGKTDIAVFRPSTGEWLVVRSSTNFSTFFGFPFGQLGDIPIIKQGP